MQSMSHYAVLRGLNHHRVTHLGFGLALFASQNVILGHTMHLVRGPHSRLIAVALLSDDVDENRPHCLC